MAETLEELEQRRKALLGTLAATGDMRRGSITESYRPCGKSTCACAQAGHPGHGPFYAFTRKVGGRTQTIQLRPGPALNIAEIVQTEVAREVELISNRFVARRQCGGKVDLGGMEFAG